MQNASPGSHANSPRQGAPQRVREEAGHGPRRPEDGGGDEMAIDLKAVLRTLWRGKFIVAATALAAIALAVAYLALRTPTFSATASVLVDRAAQSQIDIRGSYGGEPINESAISSQINVILSNRVLAAVVDDLRLDEDPAFVPDLRPDSGGFSLGQVRLAIGSALEPLFGPIPYLSPRPAAQMTDRQRADFHRRVAIGGLSGRIRAAPVGASFVIAVSASDRDPARAAELANAVVRAYIRLDRESKQEASAGAATWLTGQIAELEAQVKRSTDAVDDFRIRNGITDETQIAQSAAEVERLRSSLADARQLREGLLTDLAAAEAGTAGTEAGTAGGAGAAAATLRARVEAIGGREQALQASVESAEAELARLVRQRAEFAQLERQALADQRLYERFLDETNEVGALESYQQADARIIADALIPLNPSNPSSKIILALAAVLGAGLGVAIIAVTEMLRTTFRTREELAQFSGRPVLGTLPRVRGGATPQKLLGMLRDNPFSPFSEGVRSFRAAVLQRRANQSAVILVTSSSVREGKSTTALLLASTAADIGRRVLLIDGDLRRSRLGAALGLRAGPTIEDVLADDVDPASAIVSLPDYGFDVMASGRGHRRRKVAPLDLLSSDRMADLVHELRRDYDLVVIDTPPVLPATDAVILSRHADGVLFVVRWRRTSQAAVNDALRQLAAFDAHIDGLVLSVVDRRTEAALRAVPHHVYSG